MSYENTHTRTIDGKVYGILNKGIDMSEDNKLTYYDADMCLREVRGCQLTIDKSGRHWLWSDTANSNLACKIKGRENTFLAAIDSLLFTLQLREKRIAELKRIADLAKKFADDIKPDVEENYEFN